MGDTDSGRNLNWVLRKTKRGRVTKVEGYECSSHSGPPCKAGVETKFTTIGWGNMQIQGCNLLRCIDLFLIEAMNVEDSVVMMRKVSPGWAGRKVWTKRNKTKHGFPNEDMYEFFLPHCLLTFIKKQTLLPRLAYSILRYPFTMSSRSIYVVAYIRISSLLKAK